MSGQRVSGTACPQRAAAGREGEREGAAIFRRKDESQPTLERAVPRLRRFTRRHCSLLCRVTQGVSRGWGEAERGGREGGGRGGAAAPAPMAGGTRSWAGAGSAGSREGGGRHAAAAEPMEGRVQRSHALHALTRTPQDGSSLPPPFRRAAAAVSARREEPGAAGSWGPSLDAAEAHPRCC